MHPPIHQTLENCQVVLMDPTVRRDMITRAAGFTYGEVMHLHTTLSPDFSILERPNADLIGSNKVCRDIDLCFRTRGW